MGYPTLQYSRTEVDAAGATLVNGTISDQIIDEAFTVISNFRSSHRFPLNTLTVGLRRRSKVVSPNCLVAHLIQNSKLWPPPALCPDTVGFAGIDGASGYPSAE
jgi:hypothetical protein